MGALPKRRISRSRQGNRRGHHHLELVTLTECLNCHNMRPAHHVCPSCGMYKGVQVVKIKQAKAKPE